MPPFLHVSARLKKDWAIRGKEEFFSGSQLTVIDQLLEW